MDLSAEARAADDAGATAAQVGAIWEDLPAEQRSTAKANVDVYLENFISVVQVGPRERRQIPRHLFHQIDQGFHPKEEADTNRKDPIYLKKMGKGDGACST